MQQTRGTQLGTPNATRLEPVTVAVTVYPWASAVLADSWTLDRIERRVRRDAERERE